MTLFHPFLICVLKIWQNEIFQVMQQLCVAEHDTGIHLNTSHYYDKMLCIRLTHSLGVLHCNPNFKNSKPDSLR